MATWDDIGRDARSAAQHPMDQGHWRSSVSRSYYAVYSVIAARALDAGLTMPVGWHNPRHRQLEKWIRSRQVATHLKDWEVRWVVLWLKALRGMRVGADYKPGQSVDKGTALEAIRHSRSLLRMMEVRDR